MNYTELHYYESKKDRISRLKRYASSGHVICNNGSAHIATTTNPKETECQKCKDKIKELHII